MNICFPPRIDSFVGQTKSPLINELDLNRPKAITSLSKVFKYLKLYCKLNFGLILVIENSSHTNAHDRHRFQVIFFIELTCYVSKYIKCESLKILFRKNI